jgi:hypothetical protein
MLKPIVHNSTNSLTRGDSLIVDISGQQLTAVLIAGSGGILFWHDSGYGNISATIDFTPHRTYALLKSEIVLEDSSAHRLKPSSLYLNSDRVGTDSLVFESSKDNELRLSFGGYPITLPVKLFLGSLQEYPEGAAIPIEPMVFNAQRH